MALALFAVVVVTGALLALTRHPGSVASAASSPKPASQATAASAVEVSGLTLALPATQAPPTLLVVGADLVRMQPALAGATGGSVETAGSDGPEVLAPGALDAVQGTPDVVVLQVLAGTRTTTRTATALEQVLSRWPAVTLFVIGPFSSADDKSTASVRAAAEQGGATFLDPVALAWRSDDRSALLTDDDLVTVAPQLAAALTT